MDHMITPHPILLIHRGSEPRAVESFKTLDRMMLSLCHRFDIEFLLRLKSECTQAIQELQHGERDVPHVRTPKPKKGAPDVQPVPAVTLAGDFPQLVE